MPQSSTRAFVALQRAAAAQLDQLGHLLAPHGLTTQQFNVLRILRGAGPDGLACAEIGKRMLTRDSDITRLLDRLAKHSLILRERHGEDRRVVMTSISPRGLEVLLRLDRPVAELHRRQFAKVKGVDGLADQLDGLLP